MNKEQKSTARLILHIEDAASIIETVRFHEIARTRDGLRAMAPSVPSIAPLLRTAADRIQSVLDAKHSCPSVNYAGYGGAFGAAFDAEFAQRAPKPDTALAAELRAASAHLRTVSGIGEANNTNEWGIGVRVGGMRNNTSLIIFSKDAASNVLLHRAADGRCFALIERDAHWAKIVDWLSQQDMDSIAAGHEGMGWWTGCRDIQHSNRQDEIAHAIAIASAGA